MVNGEWAMGNDENIVSLFSLSFSYCPFTIAHSQCPHCPKKSAGISI